MASFPTSKKTWTALTSADYLQSAQVNEARDEITAIEEGYLEGSARLNSSASTLASLSVSGGSTFADVRINGGLPASGKTRDSLVVSNNVDIGGSKLVVSSAGLMTQALQTTGAVALTWNDSSGGAIAALKRYENTKMAFTGDVDFSQSTLTGVSASSASSNFSVGNNLQVSGGLSTIVSSAITLSGGVTLTINSGSPNGVVTAGLGSIHIRTGSNSPFYIKTAGAGTSTGWQLVAMAST